MPADPDPLGGQMRTVRNRSRTALLVSASLLLIPSAASANGPCTERSELQCIDSSDCTLQQLGPPGSEYTCSESTHPCEKDFRQRSGTRKECEAKGGCVYVPQSCYCAPDVLCVCGGGPPRQCLPETNAGRTVR